MGAVYGGVTMLIDPSGRMLGVESLLPMFQKLPFANELFRNFIFPGVALLCVNGVTNFAALLMLVRRHKFALHAGVVCGALLVGWIGMQLCILPLNPMSTAFLLLGAAETSTACLLLKKQRSTQQRCIVRCWWQKC